eukprot:g20089.t1
MYKQIIVAVDIAEMQKGERILRKAAQLAGESGRIVVVNVVEELPAYIVSDLSVDMMVSARKEAEQELSELRQRTGITCDLEIRQGAPAREILAAAEHRQADLIILASHVPDFSNYLIGATADRVVRHARLRKSELERRLGRIEADFVSPRNPDDDDRAVERNNDEVLEELGETGQKELAAIDAALARIARGSFGTCVHGMSDLFDFGRRYDLHEIIADGIVHGIGIVLALIGVTALIFYATVWSSYGELAAAWIYGLGLVLCLSISFTYNIWPHSRAKWLLRRLDHSAIFILIAATYTPFLQRGAQDPLIAATLIGIWLTAIFGVSLKCLFPGRYDKLAILLYLAMGWSGVLVMDSVSQYLAPVTVWLIVAGGMIYSLGVIFHIWERLRFQNAIWHAFVVAAAAVHYGAVITCFSLATGLWKSYHIMDETMNIIIRDAAETDLPPILAIYNDAVANTTAIWNETLVDLDNRRAWWEARKQRGFPVLVAEVDGAVAGYASYGDWRAFDGYRFTVEHSVYVGRDHRGCGVGRRLMEELITRAASSGVHVMIAAIEAENQASIALHQALGFRIAGKFSEVGIKFGRWLDLTCMELTLSKV